MSTRSGDHPPEQPEDRLDIRPTGTGTAATATAAEPAAPTPRGQNADLRLVIEEDRDIAILVLAAGSTKDGPGPLVSMIAGRAAAFPIPVTVLPDSLTDEEIDALC